MKYNNIIKTINWKDTEKDKIHTLAVISSTNMNPIMGDCIMYNSDSAFYVKYYNHESFITAEERSAVVFLEYKYMLDNLYNYVYTYDESELQLQIQNIKQYLDKLMTALKIKFDDVLLFLGVEDYLEYPVKGFNSWNQVILDLNSFIINSIKNHISFFAVDMNKLECKIGSENFWSKTIKFDMVYSLKAYELISREIVMWLNRDKSKKCIIVDCDGVLWGGILLEDGMENIKLGRFDIGRKYREFQRELLRLYSLGVIICLCSKNDENDVWNVFENHSEMLIQRKNICRYKINFNNKAENIKQLLEELNIKPDSVVFIDDSIYEINMINNMFPEIRGILFNPKNDVTEFLRNSKSFRRWNITEESRHRNEMYIAQAEREKYVLSDNNYSNDINCINEQLQLVTNISYLDENNLARVLELTGRCNQFNLSAKRYTYSELRSIIDEDHHDFLCLEASDILGNLGLISISDIRYFRNYVVIESFMLSCRAFGRKIEDILINDILLRTKQFDNVYGIFIGNEKNFRNSNFYSNHGIITISSYNEIKQI